MQPVQHRIVLCRRHNIVVHIVRNGPFVPCWVKLCLRMRLRLRRRFVQLKRWPDELVLHVVRRGCSHVCERVLCLDM